MHIVQLIPELNQGGVERVVIDTTRELVKRGHQVTVISAGGSQAEQVVRDGGTHIQLDVCSKNPLTFFARVQKLKTLLLKLSPDLIHVHSRVPAWLAWFANRRLKIPFVTSVHGFNSVSKYSAIMTKGDRVACSSHPVKAYIQKHYQTPESNIDVIHPGVNPSEFDPEKVDNDWIEAFKTKYELSDCFIASSVGRITELKDFETFIRAIARCVKENPTIRGLIVGGVRHDKQNYFDRLKELVHELQLEKQIHFITSGAQMPELYQLSDVIVSCSKKPESFGLTLVEALAMNTPVIATRHGGPLDIIQAGINGTLFTPQQSDELAQKLTSLTAVQNRELRTDTLERFGLDSMISKTLKLYKTVLSRAQ